MYFPNIPETDEIRELAQIEINKVFKFFKEDNPPKITNGIVTAVLKAYEELNFDNL